MYVGQYANAANVQTTVSSTCMYFLRMGEESEREMSATAQAQHKFKYPYIEYFLHICMCFTNTRGGRQAGPGHPHPHPLVPHPAVPVSLTQNRHSAGGAYSRTSGGTLCAGSLARWGGRVGDGRARRLGERMREWQESRPGEAARQQRSTRPATGISHRHTGPLVLIVGKAVRATYHPFRRYSSCTHVNLTYVNNEVSKRRQGDAAMHV